MPSELTAKCSFPLVSDLYAPIAIHFADTTSCLLRELWSVIRKECWQIYGKLWMLR